MNSRFFALVFLFASCDQRDVLVDNEWDLIGGILNGSRIEFNSIGLVRVDEQGNQIHRVSFGKNGMVFLPGINCVSLSGRWRIEDDQINFLIDYPYGTDDLGGLLTDSLVDARRVHDSTQMARWGKFEIAKVVYGQRFFYAISRDTLVMVSKNVKLWAVRDKSLDRIKEILR